jgi:LDH2 family malate/lactate/ureidoglycolate dehydrogenase
MTPRYSHPELQRFATALLTAAGLDEGKAAATAEILVEGDLLGHTTHGLALLDGYLTELDKGSMAKSGEPLVISDYPAAVTWDGRRLPGPWLVLRAIQVASERARKVGTCTVVIRRSHHLACLAAYLQRVTDEGLMMLLSCCDPAVASVAPQGGRRGVMTPNPFAAGWPTAGDPVMLDVSTSITSNGFAKRLHTENRDAPGPWFVDAEGKPTANPGALMTNPPGALLPIGGVDHGHKGYALGLLVEALTAGLSGHGRANPPEGWGASVFLQIMDPALFGGLDGFSEQTSHLANVCRQTPPRADVDRVRLPGEGGLRKRAEQHARGVELYPAIMPTLVPWAKRFGVEAPAPLEISST